ncbi:MAG: hypothetical protein NXI10_01590 [bacterium]|nr:hypothetical protein [bacterium]
MEQVYVDHMPVCNVQESRSLSIIWAISTFEGTYLIEGTDTAVVPNYTFELVNDTLSLFDAFSSIEIPEVMKETYTQGRVFLKTTLYADSTFSSTSVLRGIGPYYQPVQLEIDRILSSFRIAEPPKDSAFLIFCHRIELDEY